MVAMFLILMQKSSLSCVDHKFLIPSHTRKECDSDHLVIERKKNKYSAPIHHPRDWYQLVLSCGKIKPFRAIEMEKKIVDFANV